MFTVIRDLVSGIDSITCVFVNDIGMLKQIKQCLMTRWV